MIAAVLDANIIVSAIIVKLGIPSQILNAARAGLFVLVTSTVIVDEVLRTLNRPRVKRKYRVADEDIQDLRTLLEQRSVVTPITDEVHGVATHSEDDLILATAVSAGADYLVTGDRQLQALGSFRGVTIVNPRQFLTLLQSPETS